MQRNKSLRTILSKNGSNIDPCLTSEENIFTWAVWIVCFGSLFTIGELITDQLKRQ